MIQDLPLLHLRPRFKLVSRHNLQISGIRSQDAGDYTCKILLMEETVSITHTLEILGEWNAAIVEVT